MKKVLIAGAGSFIGTSFEKYARDHYLEELEITTIDMLDGSWKNYDFTSFDCVFHVAGIAHVDGGKASEELKRKYYEVNTDLAIESCKKTKMSGVKQFIFMSSMIIYGESASYRKEKIITKDTKPSPSNFYGDSKWQADKKIRELANDCFMVAVIRSPMIYGKGSKGNYPILAKMAKIAPIFPKVDNCRSMLYIENLCELLCQIIMRQENGIFWPQNGEYTKTSDMVKLIAEVRGHRIMVSSIWGWIVQLANAIPGKPRNLINKAFGNFCYDQEMSKCDFDYQCVSLKESIRRTEE